MDRMPFDKSDAVVLLQRTFEASSLTIAPLLFNEAANALSIPTQCEYRVERFTCLFIFLYNCDLFCNNKVGICLTNGINHV